MSISLIYPITLFFNISSGYKIAINNKVVDIFSVSILSIFQGKIQGSKTFDFSFISEKAFSKISKNSKASFLSLKYVLGFSFPLFISSLK